MCAIPHVPPAGSSGPLLLPVILLLLLLFDNNTFSSVCIIDTQVLVSVAAVVIGEQNLQAQFLK